MGDVFRDERLDNAIMSANLTRQHIPVDVEEEERKVDDSRVWLTMMREEFLILKTELSGSDGKGGILGEIKDDVSKLEKVNHHIDEKLSTLITAQIRDKAELDSKIVNVKSDIDKVGNIARGARDIIDTHIEEAEELRRFRWEQLFGIVGAIVGVSGIVIGLLLGLGG